METPFWTNGNIRLYRADARAIPLPDQSVHCVVTSPPYWGLRNYGLEQWIGGDPNCEHKLRPNESNWGETAWRRKGRTYDNLHWPNGICGRCGATQVGRWKGGDPDCLHTIRNPNTTRQSISGSRAFQDNELQTYPGQCKRCGAEQESPGIGSEPTLQGWVDNIALVSCEVWRVLRDDGTYWLNLGDAYAGSNKGLNADGSHSAGDYVSVRGEHYLNPGSKQSTNAGSLSAPELPGGCNLAAKNLMGQPWRVAFTLQDMGWILRSANVWAKNNPMPESVRDRPTNSYEMVFQFVKRPRYYYDSVAVQTQSTPETVARYSRGSMYDDADKDGVEYRMRNGPTGTGFRRDEVDSATKYDTERDTAGRLALLRQAARAEGGEYGGGRANLRNVWHISTQGYPGAHFATFPEALPRLCLLAGTSGGGVCDQCGAPYSRDEDSWTVSCSCADGQSVPATVLDPFAGSGTTLVAAQKLGRAGIGLDLNPEYLALAADRIGAINLPLLGL